MKRSYFHVHLVSDSTGETLISVGRAAAAQYDGVSAIEHVYPLIRSVQQLDRVISEIQAAPGLVLYTLVGVDLGERLEAAAARSGSPCLSVLRPVHDLFQSYLGTEKGERPGAQHTLNVEYFKRIDAMNFTLAHDDGNLPVDIEDADVILIGVSRTSKTPTSIYLANRGLKTTNVPLVLGREFPRAIETVRRPLVVGLLASAERIVEVRKNRLINLNVDELSLYVQRDVVKEEILMSRRLFSKNRWPVIDVTRRSIEETAASILDLYRDHIAKFIAL